MDAFQPLLIYFAAKLLSECKESLGGWRPLPPAVRPESESQLLLLVSHTLYSHKTAWMRA